MILIITISLANVIHSNCRSKHLITITSKLGLCTSFESLERTDIFKPKADKRLRGSQSTY